MISEAVKARFAKEVAKYPADQKQSAVMACLAIVQQELGHVSAESEQMVADYLGMPPIAVHEVTTFYNMYNQQPVGKYKLNVCTNLPCQLRDGARRCSTWTRSWASPWARPPPTACSRCSRANAWAPAPTRR
jgi:NADH-quinone oxidoreductase subunit E